MKYLFDAVGLGLLALLPLINPPTTVAVFLGLSRGLSREEKNRQAFLAAFYVCIIMLLTYYIGDFVMSVFSISIPGLRLAGGGILVLVGVNMLFPKPQPASSAHDDIPTRANFAFIPLAMPSTAGPGTIAMIISSAATIKSNTTFPGWVLLVAPPLIFILISLILWACLRSSDLIMKLTGESGIDAVSRLMGFLLVCMGVQFAINGSIEIVQTLINNNLHMLRSS
ncbi:MAG TPA: MarC family NAAT transporter [Pseudomonas sp.]|nr:MarC family NAAT transporter [Pseudomonas sp.]